MKRILLLSIIITLCMPLFGNPVDENTAKQLAQNFWKENNIMGVKGDKVFKKRMDDARFVNVAPQCGYTEFYIFNNEDGKGFVIIAADDCVTPILGYSYDNNFATENFPPNLKGWLDGYAEQIRIAVEMRASATEEIHTDWICLRQGFNLPIRSETAVDHLLSTTWDQNQFYNMLCPEDNDGPGGHFYAGCEACAMAQILKYWEYPNDAHNVVWHEYEHPVYGTLGANYSYAGGSYYWNNMPTQLTYSSSTYQKQAVASLMYHCGVSVEMNYGPDGSDAYTTSAEIAFRAFFDYNNATLEKKSSYTDTQWINLLKNELDNGRPVFYRGSGTGGHAFVCDGYNNSNYFWFNWGWSGQANGYFPVNSLIPIANGYQFDFSYNQEAIIGIEPGGTNSYHLLGMNDDIKVNGENIMYYLYFFDTQIQEITTEIYNWGNETFIGSLCAVVFDGEYFYVSESNHIDNCQILPMQSSGQLSFMFSESLNILTCKAYVGIFSIENGQYNLVSTYGTHLNPNELDNYYSDSMVDLYLYSNIEYSPTSIIQNSPINVTANIINDAVNSTFIGNYAAALYGLNGELKQILAVLHEGNGLQPGYHYINPLSFSCPSVTVPAGTYYLTIIQQSEGSDNWYPLLNWEDCVNPMYVNPIRVEIDSPAPYTITATANPNNGGTITGQGEYLEGETCTLIASANNGFTFVNWTENGTQVSTNANYTFTVTGNRNLVANFQAQPQQYNISVSANPSNGGTVTCNKTRISESFEDYTTGNKIATEALAVGHNYWTTWSDSPGSSEDGYVEYFNDTQCGHLTYGNDQVLLLGSVNSGVYDLKFDIIVPEGKNGYFSILHHFAGVNSTWAMQCYLHLTNDGQTSTSAPGHGTLHAGSNNTADLPCVYNQWMHFRILIDTNNDIAQLYFNVLGQPENMYAEWQWSLDSFGENITDCVLDAIDFFPPENNASEFYVDNIVVSNQTNYFDYGDICTLTATPNNGYSFVNWTENGTQVSTNANYSFTVTSNRNLVAHFQQQQQQYTISISANPSNGGSVSGGGTFNQGTSCTVHATANSGYTFVNWTENGTQVSTNANYTFQVTGNRTLVANFQIQSYTISVMANPSNGGTVTGGGSYGYGQTCTVTANASNGYNFVNWTENGVQVSTNASYSFTVTGNRALVANFTSQSYLITATADPSAGGVITGSGGYNYGETCTLTATANTGYAFVNWTKNGTQVSTNSTYSFTVTESATYVAHFNIQSYSITVAAYPNNAGSVTGGGSYTYGQTCTVHATANSGYTFVNWTENGTQVSSNANYTFTVTGNRSLVANFAQSEHTIQATAGANGIITPSGTVTVTHGANQSFAMVPDTGYEVQDVYIDGNSVGAITSYTFTNVTTNHYIHVTFVRIDGIDDNNILSAVVYPNPTSGEVTVKSEGLSRVLIVNTYGQTVYNAELEGDQAIIDLL